MAQLERGTQGAINQNLATTRYQCRKKGIAPPAITSKELFQLRLDHNGLCDCCGRLEFSDSTRSFHLDHDHKTGKVRGLICAQCNMGLGYFEDSTTLLRLASDYLDRSK